MFFIEIFNTNLGHILNKYKLLLYITSSEKFSYILWFIAFLTSIYSYRNRKQLAQTSDTSRFDPMNIILTQI